LDTFLATSAEGLYKNMTEKVMGEETKKAFDKIMPKTVDGILP